jgi:23S rRNA (uracil1939-C5)-methyltransferase
VSDSPAEPAAGGGDPGGAAREPSEATAAGASAPRPAAGIRRVLRCGAMVHGGACLARCEDGDAEDEPVGTVLVDGAIPGELVLAHLHGRRGGVWRARAVEVLEPSPDRVTPPCPYVPDCGGCDLQHVAYPRQLSLKREVVLDALRRQRVTVPAEVPVHGMADPWRYRRRGEFHVVRGAEGVRDAGLGFNRARSWRPIAVDDCLIHHPTISRSLPALRSLVRRGAADDLTALHLTVGGGGRDLLVRARPRDGLDPAVLDEHALAAGGDVVWHTASVGMSWRGREFRLEPETFVQVNAEQMEVLYARVLEALGDVAGRRVVDAYAGIGVLGTVLAGDGAEVVCIEESRHSARLGLLNARLNEVEERVRYVARPVEEALPALGTGAHLDAAVLDPPRAGCAGPVCAWLALAGPPQVVYVSCDPATLARDLHLLAVLGPYRVESLDLVDMFPQTHHVESVVSLRREPS